MIIGDNGCVVVFSVEATATTTTHTSTRHYFICTEAVAGWKSGSCHAIFYDYFMLPLVFLVSSSHCCESFETARPVATGCEIVGKDAAHHFPELLRKAWNLKDRESQKNEHRLGVLIEISPTKSFIIVKGTATSLFRQMPTRLSSSSHSPHNEEAFNS